MSAMMATGLVPRRGQETGGEIRCFLSWFSSLSELGSTQKVPETKQVQWELALANLMPWRLGPNSNDDLINYISNYTTSFSNFSTLSVA
jgi:hypothetical protein